MSYPTTYRTLKQLAAQLVDDPDFVDELVQDTWLKAIERSIVPGPDFLRWARVAMRNVAIDRWRSDAARRDHEHRSAVERGDGADIACDPPQGLGVSRTEMMANAMRELSESQQNILRLRFAEELSAREAGLRAGLNESAVRSQQKRAIRRLKEVLDSEHGGRRKSWAVSLLTGGRMAQRTTRFAHSWAAFAGLLISVILVGGVLALRQPSGPSEFVAQGGLVAALSDQTRSESKEIALDRTRVPGEQLEMLLGPDDANVEAGVAVLAALDPPIVVHVSGPGSRDVADAEIHVGYGRDLDRVELLGHTDLNGEFPLRVASENRWAWAVSPRGTRSDAVFVAASVGGVTGHSNIEVHVSMPAASLYGAVRDSLGHVVAGASLELIPNSGDLFTHRMDGILTRAPAHLLVVTGEDGQFNFGPLAAQRWEDYSVAVIPPSKERLSRSVVQLRTSAPGEAFDVVLAPCWPLSIDVVDSTGQIAPSAMAEVIYPGGGSDPATGSSQSSTVQFESVGETAKRVVATLPNGERASVALSAETLRGGYLRMQAHSSVPVRMLAVDRAGVPLVDWRVLVYIPNRLRQDPLFTYAMGAPKFEILKTNEQGAAVYTGAIQESKSAFLFPPSGPTGTAAAIATIAADGPREIRLVAHDVGESNCSVAGRVAPEDRTGELTLVTVRGRRIHHMVTSLVDPVTGAFEISDLPPGRSICSVISVGNTDDAHHRIELSPGQRLDLGEFEHNRGSPMLLRLVRSDGRPLVDPRMHVSRKGQLVQSSGRWSQSGVSFSQGGVADLSAFVQPGQTVHCTDANLTQAGVLDITPELLRAGEAELGLISSRSVVLDLAQVGPDPIRGMHFISIENDALEVWHKCELLFDEDGRTQVTSCLPPGDYNITSTPYFTTTLTGVFAIPDQVSGPLTVNLHLLN